MRYEIIVCELKDAVPNSLAYHNMKEELYRQVVDDLDLRSVIEVVNKPKGE